MTSLTDNSTNHVYPWWLGSLIDNPLRRMLHPAEKTLSPYIEEGMICMDFGCGFGHYSLGMAKLTGKKGEVVSIDVQQQMLNKLMKRASKQKLDSIITPHLNDGSNIGLIRFFDFILLSNSLHETPDQKKILNEMFTLTRPKGKLLLIEPKHVKLSYDDEVKAVLDTGFKQIGSPSLIKQYCTLFEKPENTDNR